MGCVFSPGRDFKISRYKLCFFLLICLPDLLLDPVIHSHQYISPLSISLEIEAYKSSRAFADFGAGTRDYSIWAKGVLISIMSNPPRIRKRVGADPSKFKRGVDGSGFITW